jgi:hypothetical protein
MKILGRSLMGIGWTKVSVLKKSKIDLQPVMTMTAFWVSAKII